MSVSDAENERPDNGVYSSGTRVPDPRIGPTNLGDTSVYAYRVTICYQMQQSGAYAPDYVSTDDKQRRRRMHTQCNKVHHVMLGPLRVSYTMYVLVDAFSRVVITDDMAAQICHRFRAHTEHHPVDEEDVARTCMRMFIGRPGAYERAIFGPDIIAHAVSISNRAADDTTFVVVDNPARIRRFIRRIASIIFRQEMRI